MITVDLSELEHPHPLDVGDAGKRAAQSLIGHALLLANGSPATAFCLLVATIQAFALDSDVPCELLEIGIVQMTELRRDISALGIEAVKNGGGAV